MDITPVTYLQQRQIEATFDASVGAGKAWISIDLSGDLDVAALVTAVGELVARHDALRIQFVRDASGGWAQYARSADEEEPAISLQQVACESEQQFLDHVEATVINECDADYDLASEPLARFYVFRLDPQRHVFAAIFSRTIVDGRSRALFIRELWEIYHCVRTTGDVPARPERPTFLDAVRRLTALNSKRMTTKNVEYWRTRLAPDPLFHKLGRLHTAGAPGTDCVVRSIQLGPASLARLSAEAAESRCTEFEVVFSRMASVLMDVLEQDRLAFMVLNDFRTVDDREVIGTFVGGVPVVLDREDTGAVSISQIQRVVLRGRVHGYTPPEAMKECFERLERETGVRMQDTISFSYLDHTQSGSMPPDETYLEIGPGPGVPPEYLSAPMLDISVNVQVTEAFIVLIFNVGVFPEPLLNKITDGFAGTLGGEVVLTHAGARSA